MNKRESEEKFLRQSYQDAWENYRFLLTGAGKAGWDWVAVTASNERQAQAYRRQIERRRGRGLLAADTRFVVVPDMDGKRIGSGGATLNVIRYIAGRTGIQALEKQKILVIHSGGDSRRIPQYSACGKLFSPIPRLLPDGGCSTLFDELLMSVSHIPQRIPAGMLVLPGDTELLFNPLQLELFSCDAAGLSIKTNIAEGTEHGVFLGGTDRIVRRFLHKQPEHVLRETGAADTGDSVDIDTGCIWFGHGLVGKLAGLFYIDGEYSGERFCQFVNERVRLSFYADFVSPLASESTWEDYREEKPEGDYSDELVQCRRELWEVLHPFRLELVRMAPARYIHVGTTEELYNLMVREIDRYHYLGWMRRAACSLENGADYSGINSYVSKSAGLDAECYVENSMIMGGTKVAPHTILSGVSVSDVQFPGNIVLHGLKLDGGGYVCRIYGVSDNPKGSADSAFLGSTLREFLEMADIDAAQVWTDCTPSIWNARIYAECESCKEAVDMALLLYRIVRGQAGKEEVEKWKMAKRHSLESSFAKADTDAALNMQEEIRDMVTAENVITRIRRGEDVRQTMTGLREWNTKVLQRVWECARMDADLFVRVRLCLGLSFLCGKYKKSLDGRGREAFENTAYEQIKQGILQAVSLRHKRERSIRLSRLEVEESLPVRVNFCGSPSDAAPYCLEHGGTMLDAAVLLKGKMPVRVTVKRTGEQAVRFASRDLGEELVCTRLQEIQDCGNPYDTFALHKAVLLAAGVVPLNGGGKSMQDLCAQMGGGLAMTTEVDVPKGSGLGTSSILAAAAIRALHRMAGENVRDEQVYAEVFLAEQLMNTGGGWQDQAGGLTPGLKLMRTAPGMYQEIQMEQVSMTQAARKELQERFALIYSGQRRLARNVLREEMNRCAENNRQSLESVEQIRKLCVLMKYELERGNITGFARYITEQFELVKELDKGASNTCIEYIFDCCADLLDGKSVCGAGGGGFLQVVLKKGIGRDRLCERLQEVFKGCGVEVWESAFLWG